MSGNIYVIRSENVVAGRYKIGRCKGNSASLLRRYKTSLGDPKIEYFVYCADSIAAERDVLNALSRYRVSTDKGVQTEWVDHPLENIKATIDAVIAKYVDTEPAEAPKKAAPKAAPKPKKQLTPKPKKQTAKPTPQVQPDPVIAGLDDDILAYSPILQAAREQGRINREELANLPFMRAARGESLTFRPPSPQQYQPSAFPGMMPSTKRRPTPEEVSRYYRDHVLQPAGTNPFAGKSFR